MNHDDEYTALAIHAESRGGDYLPKVNWLPIWLGAGLAAALGVGMWAGVRLLAWWVR